MTRAELKLFHLRKRDIAKVVFLGLAQVATLILFVLLVIDVGNALTPDSVGAEAEQARNDAYLNVGLLALVALAYAWLRAAEFSISEKVGYNVVRDLRMRMYFHLQGMTPRQLQNRARGGLILRFIGDLSMLRMWISRGLLGGIAAVIVLVGTTITLAILDAWIALSIIAALFLGAAVSLTSGATMRLATRKMRRRRSLVTGNIDEQINAMSVVQVFGRSSGEYSRLSRQNEDLNAALCRIAELRGRLRGIAAGSGLLAVVAVLGVGMIQVSRGYASVGLVLAAVLVTRHLNRQVLTLGLAHDYWHRAQVSEQKIGDFLTSSSRGLSPVGLERLVVRRGLIEFRDVSVSRSLRGVTLTANPGGLVAITGGAGAGKSSLLALVARLLEPDSGEVRVDEQVLASTTPSSAFKYVGVVGTDLPLMRGSLRRNITYSAPEASADEIQRVVMASGLDDVIAELPDGLDTWITEGGRSLSTAQRQRIAFARALLNNPPILLLDDPTAGLDPTSRMDLRSMITRHQGTVLHVTNDADEIAMADQVWVLERGVVTEVLSGDEYDRQQWLAQKTGVQWPAHVAS